MRADNKLHKRTEAPNGWRPKKMQSRNRRFKPVGESRVTSEATYGICQFRVKEVVLGNVYSVSGSQQNVVNGSDASIIKLDLYAPANLGGADAGTAKAHGYTLKPLYQPARTGGPDRSTPEPILNRSGQPPHQVRPRYNLADAGRPDVSGRVQQF